MEKCAFGERVEVLIQNMSDRIVKVEQCVDMLRTAIYGNGNSESHQNSIMFRVKRMEEDEREVKEERSKFIQYLMTMMAPIWGLLAAALFKTFGLM